MRVFKLNGKKLVLVNTKKYLISWDGPSRSNFQYDVKQWLKPYWKNCICCEELRIPGSLLRLDLVNISKKIIVEISGSQHLGMHWFHGENGRYNYLHQIKNDVLKRQWAEKNDFIFVEIYDKDLPLSKKFFEKWGIIL